MYLLLFIRVGLEFQVKNWVIENMVIFMRFNQQNLN